ncbi:MAG: SHOCT domain-containing protein [Bacteroidota bacterium]
MHWMDWAGHGWMMIFWWVFVIGIIYLVIRLIAQKEGKKGEESALDVLKKRYARGEISKKEYDQKQQDLI